MGSIALGSTTKLLDAQGLSQNTPHDEQVVQNSNISSYFATLTKSDLEQGLSHNTPHGQVQNSDIYFTSFPKSGLDQGLSHNTPHGQVKNSNISSNSYFTSPTKSDLEQGLSQNTLHRQVQNGNIDFTSTTKTDLKPISEVKYPYQVDSEFLLKSDDIIHPNLLVNFDPNKYTLLIHSADSIEVANSIREKGLKSLHKLTKDDENNLRKYDGNPHEKYFGNDPTLIYFRPLVKNASYTPASKYVVIVVTTERVSVFNQEWRGRGETNISRYNGSRMTLNKFNEESEKANSSGKMLDMQGGITTHECISTYWNGISYVPEVCVLAEEIKPAFFVKDWQKV